MPLGMKVGLSPGDFVLDRDPALLSQKGVEPPIFSSCLSWPNVLMYQDATWYGGRPRPRHIVLDRDPAPAPLKGHSPQFLARVHCGQMARWTKMPLGTEVGLGPGDFVFDGEPAPPHKKRHSPHTQFLTMSIVAKLLAGSRCQLLWSETLAQATMC